MDSKALGEHPIDVDHLPDEARWLVPIGKRSGDAEDTAAGKCRRFDAIAAIYCCESVTATEERKASRLSVNASLAPPGRRHRMRH
jgi:hypothetical protein